MWTAGAAALLAACGHQAPDGRQDDGRAPDDPADAARVRTEPAPLERRFTVFGRLMDAHWLGYDLVRGNNDRTVPGPSDIRLVGFARPRAGVLRDLRADPAYRFVPSPPTRLPRGLKPYAPGRDAAWLHSEALDAEVTGGRYSGSFRISTGTGLLHFDTVNATPR